MGKGQNLERRNLLRRNVFRRTTDISKFQNCEY